MHLMRLTAFTDYSLRVLIYVAAAPEGRATVGEIARAFRVSEHHLVKVVQRLGKAGFLENRRGRGGGLRLARPAERINLAEVVRAMEGEDVPAECFARTGNRCALAGGCGLQRALREALAAFHAVLGRYTLADLGASPAKLALLLRRAA